MEQSQVFVSFFLDASRPKADGKCLIKLNIYQKPNKERYKTKFHATKEEWEKMNAPKLRDEELKEINKGLAALKTRAEKVTEKINPFSFVVFEELFFSEKPGAVQKSRKLEDWFKATIRRLNDNEQVGTASTYNTTINSINAFKKGLFLQDITPTFLQNYEKKLRNESKTPATVGIYMRNLRAIINEAIKDKFLSKDNYPFAQYEIPSGQNVKKALRDFDINTLLSYKPVRADHQKALDFWVLSYLCNGMNFADIIKIKRDDISGNFFSFFRQKTIRTKKKDLRPIKVGLNPRALEIIERRKNTELQNPYLFPFLESGLKAKTIKNKCQRLIKWVNERMYAICADLGIEHKTSTYAARHTFSTVLKRKGAPMSFIKDSLGHASASTTENYLDSFEDDTTLEYANSLTEFQPAVLKVI